MAYKYVTDLSNQIVEYQVVDILRVPTNKTQVKIEYYRCRQSGNK